jgi:AAA+ superfamily predicted ATPase
VTETDAHRHYLEQAWRAALARLGTTAETPESQPAAEGGWRLDHLTAAFRLSAFERDVLLLAVGWELDRAVARDLAAVGCAAEGRGVLMAPLLDAHPSAHWSALAPTAPLCRWQLLAFDERERLRTPVRPDQRALLGLLGVPTVDAALLARGAPVMMADDPLPSIEHSAQHVAARWAADETAVVQVVGGDREALVDVAARAAAHVGYQLWRTDVDDLPSGPEELDRFTRLIERELVLGDVIVALDATAGDLDPTSQRALNALVERTQVPLAVLSPAPTSRWLRPAPSVEVATGTTAERVERWRHHLAGARGKWHGEVQAVAFAFPLSASGIRQAAADAASADGASAGALWTAARKQARLGLEALAHHLTGDVGWDDLVLPDTARQTLEEIASHVRGRPTVHEDWGFAAQAGGVLSVSALFHGPSGVGKTLAARVLGAELGLDVFRVDLSQTVSKYVGETEKNLRRIFDAAESASAVVLFDEADALFGKRSEVQDAHDRYANIEVSYLLQRMETYRGLAILTSNLPANIDGAFLRRLRYRVAFPFPDAGAREAIWRRAFPAGAPIQDLDPAVLARLSVSGASIASIALGAAVLAADAGQRIGMEHVRRAAETEYAKLDRQFTPVEVNGWPAPGASNAAGKTPAKARSR